MANGPCIECKWCGHTFLDTGACKYESYGLIKHNTVAAKTDTNIYNDPKCDVSRGEESANDRGDYDDNVKGALHKADSSDLMKILYAARMTRPDLVRPTTRLASYVT